MALTHFFLRNRRFSLVVFAFLLALGLQALMTIPLSEDPALEIPRYDVLAILPGTESGDMEKLVVRPMEDAMKELDDVKRITATIRDSVAQLSVEFTFGTDTDKKYDDVLRQVNALRSRLPATLARLEVLRGQTTNVAIMQLAVLARGGDKARMLEEATSLIRRIESVDGVKKAEMHAAPEKEVSVTLKIAELTKKNISVQQIIAAIQASNVVIPGGVAEDGDHHYNVKTGGALASLDQLLNLSLAPDLENHSVIRLRDVADVGWHFDQNDVFGRYNGERAIFLTATMQKGRNIFTVSDGIKVAIASFRKNLPEDMRIEIGFDQSQNVAHRLTNLEHDFVLALLLVLVTLAPLGFRSSIIVMISIPLCLALGLAALQWFGFSLNQLSIVGCVIALGLLVDDSIVVVENIARFRRDGHNPMEAARLATKQISVAVIGTTATLLFAFLPLLMLPEAAGLFIRSLPAAIVFAVIASLFVALSIVPWLASMLLSDKENADGNAVLRVFHRAIAGFYRPILALCMRHRITSLLLAAAISIGSFALIPSIGFSLFPRADTPQFLVQITAAEGASIPATDSIVKKVEALLQGHLEVKSMFTTIGEGNPRVYYNVFPTSRKANTAAIFVSLHSYDNNKTPALIEKLRNESASIAGVQIDFKEFENGPPITAPIEVRIVGEDLDELSRLAAEFASTLTTISGVRDVRNPVRARRTEFETFFDDDKLAMFGINKVVAQQSVRLAFAGLEAGKFREGDGNERRIRLSYPQGERATLKTWDDALVFTAAGRYIPLKQIARLELSSAPAVIERRDRERLVTISAHVQHGFNTNRVTQAVHERLLEMKLPAGYRYEFGGEEESSAESFAGFGNAILLAVFGILAILVIEFKTFRGTLIVASVIPLGIVGGLVGLWLTGYSLSFMAVVGFIALIGIEIKNSILLVDFTNQLRAKGIALDEAIAQAGEIRFLPVVLTTLTALGALLPLALQHSPLYSPLAIVIMGGSLSSLMLSRLVTPVLYRVFPPTAKIV